MITSRAQDFAAINLKAQRLVLPSHDEAVLFLLDRTGRSDASDAERQAAGELAAELGKLPLALEQAGAYLVARGASFADYLASFRQRGIDLFEKAPPLAGTRHAPLMVTWSLNIAEIERTAPASADLLNAAAFLAPDAIPDEFSKMAARRSRWRWAPPSKAKIRSPWPSLPLRCCAIPCSNATAKRASLTVHRLVQEVVKDGLGDARTAMLERVAEALRRTFPWPEFAAWPRCERLLAHVFAIVETSAENDPLAWLLNATGAYLYDRARYAEAEPLYQRALGIRGKDPWTGPS